MPRIEGGVKLKRGTATRLATKRNLSITHVNKVAKGERQGSKELVKAIKQAAKRQQQHAA